MVKWRVHQRYHRRVPGAGAAPAEHRGLRRICNAVPPADRGAYRAVQDGGLIIFNDYLSLLKTLICSCGFNPDKTTEILSMVTGMLHGYTTLQLRYAFSNPDKVRKELSEAIDTLLLGANQKYKD